MSDVVVYLAVSMEFTYFMDCGQIPGMLLAPLIAER